MVQLKRSKSDNAPREYALQILKLQEKKNSIFRDLDYLEENGILLGTVKKKTFATPEIQRLHVQISKEKKRLLQEPDKIRTKDMLLE